MTAEQSRAWRARRKAAGLSIHSPQQMAKSAAWLASTYHALRQQLYDIVGRVCIGCGHSDCRVLEFDHKDDDGAVDRRRFKGARPMLQFYVTHPDEARKKLQSLCRNCNWLKRRGERLPLEEHFDG